MKTAIITKWTAAAVLAAGWVLAAPATASAQRFYPVRRDYCEHRIAVEPWRHEVWVHPREYPVYPIYHGPYRPVPYGYR
jgi:hypothetical protein